jgi:hypothetical protein
MPGPLTGTYAGHMVKRGSDDVPYSVAMQRIAMPACAVIAVLVTFGVIHGMTGQSAPLIAAAAVALAVALAGIGWTMAGRPATHTCPADATPPAGRVRRRARCLRRRQHLRPAVRELSVANLGSEDVGAAFLFAVGVFVRSMRVAQARAQAASDRAEELLVQLRASQAGQARR